MSPPARAAKTANTSHTRRDRGSRRRSQRRGEDGTGVESGAAGFMCLLRDGGVALEEDGSAQAQQGREREAVQPGSRLKTDQRIKADEGDEDRRQEHFQAAER